MILFIDLKYWIMKMDWKISKAALFIAFHLWALLIGDQEVKNVYFYFDKDSKKTYLKHFSEMSRDGKLKGQVKVYQRYGSENKRINFYIYGLLFVHKKKMEKIIKPIDFLEKHKLLSAEETVKFIKEITSLENGGNGRFSSYEGGVEGLPKIYIVEKKDSSHVILYRVIWEPYIEWHIIKFISAKEVIRIISCQQR